jgi:WD40 repeat protein/energy-coupling factor transporter ATP-binding protein EcfA2
MNNPDVLTTPQIFVSLLALRTAHTRLIAARRETGETPELLADIAAFIREGQAAGALLDAEEDRWGAQSLLDYWANVLDRAGLEAPEATLAEFDPLLAPELPDSLCPYVGLDAFYEEEVERFFGRQQLIAMLIDRINEQRLLVIVGPSGSGKSSLVRAGLIPALRDGAAPGSNQWLYLPPMVPGHDPQAQLLKLFRHSAQIETVDLHTPMVLVIDQFEEIFTLCDDVPTRQAFIDNLLALIDAQDAAHRVILTMRSDFETFVARVPELQARFADARVQMTPLSAAEVREVIEAPAAAVGLKFETDVVDLLIQDILGEPAGLPLLQFSLLKLWEHRERNRVTRAAYDCLGGGRLALARSADAFYAGLIPEEQITARRILLRIVRPGEGLEVTSSRVQRETIHQDGEDPGRVDRVLEKLVNARLVRLTPGAMAAEDHIEVAHEALVRNWPTLVTWLQEERSAIATRRRLESRAVEWGRLGRGEAGLLDPVEQREAERWLHSPEAKYVGVDPALPALLAASREAAQRAEHEREAARERELTQARRLADERARAAQRLMRRTNQRTLALALAMMAAGVAFIFGLQADQLASDAQQQRATAIVASRLAQQQEATARVAVELARTEREAALATQSTAIADRLEAERQRRLARAGELAVQARSLLQTKPQLGLLLAVEALTTTVGVGESPAPAADETLRQALAFAGGIGLSGHGDAVAALAISPDGRLLATGSADRTIRLWDLTTAEPAASVRTLQGHTDAITTLAISPDGRRLVSGGADAMVCLWDLTAPDPSAGERCLSGHEGSITALAISPDSRWAATGSVDTTARLWDLAADDPGASAVVLSGHSDEITSLAISPDGRQLITGSLDRNARIWSISDSEPGAFRSLVRSRAQILTVAISPDNRLFVTGGDDGGRGRAEIWALSAAERGTFVSLLLGHQEPITNAVFSPNNRWLATGSVDRTTRLWEPANLSRTNTSPIVLNGHAAGITALQFSPDARRLVTSSDDHTVRLWDIAAANPAATATVLHGHDGPVMALVISNDNATLLTGSVDQTARIWSLPPPDQSNEINAAPTTSLVNLACRTASRNLTQEEWGRFFAGQAYRKTCQ